MANIGLGLTQVAQSSAMRLPESEKQEFASWTACVLSDGYLARHEFKRVGYLPQRVLNDAEVAKIGVAGNEIEVSDYLLRHGNRAAKDGRGAALEKAVLSRLPAKLESADWYFDARHGNVMAAFEIDGDGKVGKAIVQFNYTRRKDKRNAVITTGMVEAFNLFESYLRKI